MSKSKTYLDFITGAFCASDKVVYHLPIFVLFWLELSCAVSARFALYLCWNRLSGPDINDLRRLSAKHHQNGLYFLGILAECLF